MMKKSDQQNNHKQDTSPQKASFFNRRSTFFDASGPEGRNFFLGNIIQPQQATGPSGDPTQQNNPGEGQQQGLEAENKEIEACSPEEQALKNAFLQTAVFGPTSLAHSISPGSGIGIGGFEATYFTRSQLLRILVNGKIQFVDAIAGAGGAFIANHTQLSSLATYLSGLPADLQNSILPFFQWSDDQKQIRLADFRQRLSETLVIWQETGMHFEIGDSCWSDIRATPFFDLNVTEEGTIDASSDHLQVRIFKSPTPDELVEINRILNEAGQANVPNNVDTEIRAYAGTNMGTSGGTTDENPLNNEMALSSNDLDSHPDDTRGGNNFLRRSILFPFGSAKLTNDQKATIRNFVLRFNSGDTIAENNQINLRGFASFKGSTKFNTKLVDKRLAAVKNEILAAGVTEDRITLDNRSDVEAEGLSQDQEVQDNEQRVEIRIGSGERQNTVAHEFGHIFGLSDEYAEGARTAGQNAWHHPTAVGAGVTAGAQIENSDNIISLGNTVRPQHYSTFAWALDQLTNSSTGGKNWVVKE